MAAITGRPVRLQLLNKFSVRPTGLVTSLGLAVLVGWLGRFGLVHPWVVALEVAIIMAVEVAPHAATWRKDWLDLVPVVVTGAAAAIIVALASPRLATQVLVALLYALWRTWRRSEPITAVRSLTELLALQGVAFEALFLAAAIWHAPVWTSLLSVWLIAYILIYQGLMSRRDRLARILAATWALIAVEVSWVFLTWLVSYVLYSSYLIVPQPALILTGLCYCFGGIYISQQQKALTRARLAEYLFIVLLLMVIVVSGTPWRPSL